METKFELHPDLKNASLEKACEMANELAGSICGVMDNGMESLEWQWEEAKNLHYMLEYLRLNFDLVPKK